MTNPTSPFRHAQPSAQPSVRASVQPRVLPGLLPRMLLALLALTTVLVVAGSVPASATEGEATDAPIATEVPDLSGAPEGAAEADAAADKITISDNPHDQFGLILFGLMGLGALAMGANAVKQLRGERPQADGRIRWR